MSKRSEKEFFKKLKNLLDKHSVSFFGGDPTQEESLGFYFKGGNRYSCRFVSTPPHIDPPKTSLEVMEYNSYKVQ